MTWDRDEPQSPCVKICMIHPESKLCVGCGRTMDEISGWLHMPAETRSAILEDLPNRPKAPRHRRGGRRARIS